MGEVAKCGSIAAMPFDDLRAIAEYIRKEGRVIKDAPVAFALCVVLTAGVVFGAVEWHYSGEIATQQATIAMLQEELKGTSPQLAAIQANRDTIRKQLQTFYIERGKLFNRPIRNEDEAKKLVADANLWASTSFDWIAKNMGEAAAAKFVDPGRLPTFNYTGAFSSTQSNVMGSIYYLRHNLSTLIETAAWDGTPAKSNP